MERSPRGAACRAPGKGIKLRDGTVRRETGMDYGNECTGEMDVPRPGGPAVA